LIRRAPGAVLGPSSKIMNPSFERAEKRFIDDAACPGFGLVKKREKKREGSRKTGQT